MKAGRRTPLRFGLRAQRLDESCRTDDGLGIRRQETLGPCRRDRRWKWTPTNSPCASNSLPGCSPEITVPSTLRIGEPGRCRKCARRTRGRSAWPPRSGRPTAARAPARRRSPSGAVVVARARLEAKRVALHAGREAILRFERVADLPIADDDPARAELLSPQARRTRLRAAAKATLARGSNAPAHGRRHD